MLASPNESSSSIFFSLGLRSSTSVVVAIGLPEGVNDFARDFAWHGDAAQVRFADGGNQILGRAAFEQIAAGAGPQCRQNVFRVLTHADHDDLN